MEEGTERFNRIGVDDFWYMEKLGEGAFGKVVGPFPLPSQQHPHIMPGMHKTHKAPACDLLPVTDLG